MEGMGKMRDYLFFYLYHGGVGRTQEMTGGQGFSSLASPLPG